MRKRLTKRTKWILGIGIPLVLIIVTACVFLFGGKKGEVPVKPEDSISICLTPPANGAPDDYSGLDNIGYIAGKLRSQPYFHSDMKGSIDAMVTQEVYGYKDYKDGVLITSSISIAHSSLAPSKAIQKFFGDGKAVIRMAASDDPDDWKGAKTAWSKGKPSDILSRSQYEEKYGMWGNEMTDYIINSGSLLSCTEPQKGADGTYTMTASLDPRESTYYYKHQMITMGELSTYPEFQSIKLTFRFKEDWTLLSYDIHEQYETYVSVITADCEAKMTVTYTYDEAKVDVSAYENYFKKYANAAPIEQPKPQPEASARDYLTAAFGPLLLGDCGLDFTAQIGESAIEGKLALDISLNPGIQFNGLQANIGGLRAGLIGQDVVLAYQDFNGKIALNDLLSLFGVNPVNAAALDADALLSGLMEAPLVKENGKAYLNATLDLGGLPIHIGFTFNDGEVIELEKIEAGLELSGLPIALTATLGDKTDFVELDSASATDLAPFIGEIVSLIEGKNYAIGLTYGEAGDKLTVSGNVIVNAKSSVAVGADITVAYDGIAFPVKLAFADGCAYVQYEDIKIKGTIQEIETLVSQVLKLEQVQPEPAKAAEIEIVQIVNTLLSVNYDELIKGLSLTETGLQLTVDGDKLLVALKPFIGDMDFELGEIELSYSREDKAFNASVLGAEVTFTAGEELVILPENADEYVGITEVVELIEEIVSVIESKNYAIGLTYGNEGDEFRLSGSVTVNAETGVAVGAELKVIYAGAELPVSVVYAENCVYAACKDIKIKGTIAEIETLIEKLLAMQGNEAAAISEETKLDTEELIKAILSIGYDELIKHLSLQADKIELTVDGDKLLGALKPFIGDMDFALGEVALSYNREEKAFGASLLGVQLTLTGSDEAVTLPEDADDYVSIAKIAQFIDPIYALTQAGNIAFGGAFKTEIEGVALGVDLTGYVALGEEISFYIKANVAIDDWLENIEILYKEGGVTLVYGGMALTVPQDEISLLTQELSMLLNGGAAATLALTESEVLDIAGIIEQISLYNASEEKLGVWLGLSGLIGEDVSDFDGEVFIQEGKICLMTSVFTASGITLENVALSVGAIEEATEPDYTEIPVCTNVLEFVFGAYREFADTEYLGLNVAYASETMNLTLNGSLQFAKEENDAASVINLDVSAAIQTRQYDETLGDYVESDTHYLRVVILEEQAWLSYSLKAVDAPSAVFVTLPISELFVAGGNILPILSPMLGITEDVYYYDFVVKILSGAYERIHTDIIEVMTLEEWLGLIRGIIAEQSATPMVLTEEETEPVFVWGEDENGDTMIEISSGELALTLTMLKNGGGEIVAPTPPEGKNYIDISSIATLLTDVLNAYAYKDSGYALSGNLSLSVIGLTLKDIQLNLQIKSDEEIALIATLVPKSGTVTRLTIQGGYVYITRVVRKTEGIFTRYEVTTTEHRAMTMEQFSADMMEQIYFILNLNTIEQGIINSALKNTKPTDTVSEYDAGDMVKGYVYKETEYDITLNLGAILNDSAFGDVEAVITREQLEGKDYYDLAKIEATVGISVLSFNLLLTHDSAIDATKLELDRIDQHLGELLTGLAYTDFETLHVKIAEEGIQKASSEVRVRI